MGERSFRTMMKLVVLLLGSAAAYDLSMSRRTLLRVAATTPLAVVLPALADADNKYLGAGKAGLGAGDVDKYGAAKKAIGRPGALIDEAGSAVPSTATYTANQAANTATDAGGIRLAGTYLDGEGAKIKVQTIGTNKLL